MMKENMKPSGIEWIGEIPESWEVKRIKYCAEICNGGEYKDIEIEEGGYPVIGSGGEFARANKFCYSGKSVLLGRKGTVDKPLYIDGSFWCVDTMFYTKMKSITNAKYFYYCSLLIRFDYYMTSTALPSMTQRDLGSEKIFMPPLSEQTRIANYLDKQCGKIDSIIADLEKQIEILGQYKKSLITETVTRGLDKTVPLKDSGIEWIGKIPEHWEVKRMQDVGTYKKGPFGSSITLDMFVDKDETTIKIYEQKNAIQSDATLGWYYISYADYTNLRDFEVFSGDIIVSCAGTMGKCYIMPENIEKGIINQALMKITLLDTMNKKYFLFLFNIALEFMTDKYSNGSAIKNIPPFSVLKKENIPLPSFEEQTQIANYLDKQCSKIDSIIESKKEQLAKITEHKKSLIYEYVTGKKRVKGELNYGN